MNTDSFSPSFSPRPCARRPGRLAVLAAVVLIVALLLPDGVSWSTQAAPPTQEIPPGRLPYDGLFDLPQLAGAASGMEAAPALTEPEYTEWSRLVFQSARNQRDWEIYIARGDGANQVNISNHSSMDVNPRLNRGATRIAFASNRHGNYEIFAMSPNGSGQTRLTTANGNDILPAWSPDGNRIAFQAYRDGQAEIYVMNADGSGQTRLTNHGDYDGEPAWSPDGSQIAFVRRASGQYLVWAMAADGSNQRQLSYQANSENPAWSPDGSQIAYDCDGDGDGWQEIWLMDADGSNQRMVYDPTEPDTDAWVGNWSPDGRYVAFTRISWTYYQGQWYWTTAYLNAWDSVDTWRTILLSGNGADWNPGWESTDAQAPTSSVQPLPAQSPGPFAVAWSGSDAGGSELKDFDVQVKDGANGVWSNWKTGTGDLSDSYPGVGGHTYFFRSRARDNAGNVEAWPATHDAITTVEANPPQTAVFALPAFSRNGLQVRWGGSDPGGSGIQSYDVQYRQGGSGAWIDWRMDVTETSATFNGVASSEYRFRSRALDWAQNLESWPASADAATTLYTWAVTGQATDNRGAPVAGMAVTTAPAAFHTAPSDGEGAYAAHIATEATSYSASWSKAGYGSLPSTAFAPSPDAAVDVVLPPGDNVVQNWGFENGSNSWQFGGNLTAAVANGAAHSGVAGAFLGSDTRPLQSMTTLAGPAVRSWSAAASVIDPSGVIHAVWAREPDQASVYSSKRPGGSWSVPEPIPGTATPGLSSTQFSLAVDGNGVIHLIWDSNDGLYYTRREAGSGWLASERVPGTSYPTYSPTLAIGAGNAVKVLWSGLDSGSTGVLYSQRSSSGVWTSPTVIDGMELRKMVTDSFGRAHLLMDRSGAAYGDCYYTAETLEGTWLPPFRLSEGANCYGKDIAVDANSAPHVVWNNDQGMFYRNRIASGSWSPIEQVSTDLGAELALAVDRLSGVHVAWEDTASGRMRYSLRSHDVWSTPEDIGSPTTVLNDGWGPRIVADANLRVHVLWKQYTGAAMRYAVRDIGGRWSTGTDLGGTEHFSYQPELMVDPWSTPHVLWVAGIYSFDGVMYVGPQAVISAGEASMAQTIQVMDSAPAPTLSFLHRFDTEFPSNSRLEAVVDDGISPTVVFSATTGSNTWAHQWADLTPWAGRSVTLRFKVVEEAGGSRAGAAIDEVTVGSAHPDIFVSLPARLAAARDRTFDTTITYGNRGGVAASGGQVTLQLPAELSFVSANPPPSATTPTLRWDVGALPAQSGSQTIRVTLQVTASATGGTTVTTTARITSSTTELEQANNTAPGSVYLGSVRYLPVIMR